MKALNSTLKLAALLTLMGSFTLTPVGMALAEDKQADTTAESITTEKAQSEEAQSEEGKNEEAKSAETDDKAGKEAKAKKKGKDGEEPECE